MSDRPAVIYYYDGTYMGFLSCVFESFAEHEDPVSICAADAADQTALFGAKYIETDRKRAERVRVSIPKKMGLEAQDLLERAFLTCLPQREKHMLAFMRLGYRVGRPVCGMLADPVVHTLDKAVKFLGREAHLFLGFLRFAECGDVLIAQIEPKNNVLPVIAPHFISRFSGENFMIFDRTHRLALLYKDGEPAILRADTVELPPESPGEQRCRAMWRTFYDTVGIEGRRNDVCRRTHMAKRYWRDTPELGHLV